jgi:Integrase core domain
MPVTAQGGDPYFVTLVDHYSGYLAFCPVHLKSQMPHVVIGTLREWERQTGEKVKVLRIDRGTEFLNKELRGFCHEEGIVMESSVPYCPEQNGVVERAIRTVMEKARTMLVGCNADESLWADSVVTAAYLQNLVPKSGRTKAPWELMKGEQPKGGHLRVWGCLAYAKKEKHQASTFASKSEAGMLVGYEEHSVGYRIRLHDRTITARNVLFVESVSGAGAVGLAAECEPTSVMKSSRECDSSVLPAPPPPESPAPPLTRKGLNSLCPIPHNSDSEEQNEERGRTAARTEDRTRTRKQ